MRKSSLILLACILILILLGCSNGNKDKADEKYVMNGSVAYGAADNSGLEKTIVTYKMTITGSVEDINNIDAQQPLVNPDYMELLVENGPHESKIVNENRPYLEISGRFVFTTEGKTKEEIDDMDLFKGIEIIDQDNNSHVLIINGYKEK